MRFLFGDIVVDDEQIELTKAAKRIEFEPRVFELLVYFCQHPQEAISREELVTKVWRGRVVSDAAINRAVGELRKLIEDNPSSPQWIKTVSKVGYRLAVAPVLQNKPNDLHQAATTEAESTPVDTKTRESMETQPTMFSENKSFSSRLKGPWLFVAFALSMVFIYKLLEPASAINSMRVIGWQPVTSTLGSAFNANYNEKYSTFIYLHRTSADALAQLYIKKANSPAQALTNDNYYYTDAMYATDGYIYASRLNNLQQRVCEIVKINPATMELEPLIDCGARVVTQLAFDPQQRRLLYRSRASVSEPYAMYSYQLETGRKQQLTHPMQTGNTTGDYAFALSPDAQTLAVIEYRGDETDKIKLISLNDNSIILTTSIIDDVAGIVWHSADDILLSNASGLFDFNVNNLSINIIEHGDQFSRLSMGDSQRRLLTERSQSTVNIVRYSNRGSELGSLTQSSGINLNPILGNSTDVLAFISNRTGTDKIYIQAKEGEASIAAFDEEIDYISGMAFSPEDDKLVASINNILYLYLLDDKQWQAIAKSFTKVHHVAYIEDRIMFSAEVNGQWNIWQYSLNNNSVSQLTNKGGYSVQGNSNYVYYTKFNRQGLFQLDLTTGIESTIIDNFPISGWRHWQLRDNTIYYLRDKSYQALNLTTGEQAVIYNFAGRVPNSCQTGFQHDFFVCDKVESDTSNVWTFQLSD